MILPSLCSNMLVSSQLKAVPARNACGVGCGCVVVSAAGRKAQEHSSDEKGC